MKLYFWLALVAAALSCRPLSACSCRGPFTFSEKLPDRTSRDTAIFVGTVVSSTTVRNGPGMEQQPVLKVIENFAGTVSRTLVLRTPAHATACGVRFAAGATYLVEARRDNTGTWHTSTCSRTKPIDRAREDLRVLRAWSAR